MEHIVPVISIHNVTHDTLQIRVEKPADYPFNPGQATDVSINKEGWKDELRPFTFTSLPEHPYLEFTIKTYPQHKGVTNELLNLSVGDALILHDVFGDIGYKGKGVFIAGGAGVTPFISIFRYLKSRNEVAGNKLIFANKKKADIIHEQEFRELLGADFINILSDEQLPGFANGYISASFLKGQLHSNTSPIYLCGPDPMMAAVESLLADIGIPGENIVKEGF